MNAEKFRLSVQPHSSVSAAPAVDASPSGFVLAPLEPHKPAGDNKAASSYLAARRRKVCGGLRVDEHLQKLEVPAHESSGPKRITRIDHIADHYILGCEVMESTNRGMEVLHARRVADGANVVVKTRLKSKSFVLEGEEADWRRHTEMLLNLPKSENIAELYDVFEDGEYYYIAMEKCEGMDLFETMDKEGPCSIGESRVILRKLLQGVLSLHSRGCIHKDLKLENIMIERKTPSIASIPTRPETPRRHTTRASTGPELAREKSPDPVVKLIDFDTVEEYNPRKPRRARTVNGSDQYIAQEAYAGQYSTASDIFAVGVVAYRLVCGRFPFRNRMFDDKPGENYVGSPKMKQIQKRLLKFEIDWSRDPWPQEVQARELTEWMLRSNEDERPSATEALNHVFLSQTGLSPALPQGPWGSRRAKKTSQANMEIPEDIVGS